MKAFNSVNAKEVAVELINDYNRRLKMIEVVSEVELNTPYTIFVKYLKTPKSYYNASNQSITLIFVPCYKYSVHTQGNHTNYWFDKEVYRVLETKDTIYNAEWEYRNQMIPLEKAIPKLLELPFTNIEIIKL